jgi:hypothetical protein
MFEFTAWEPEEPASFTRTHLKNVEGNHIYGMLKIIAYSGVFLHSAPSIDMDMSNGRGVLL